MLGDLKSLFIAWQSICSGSFLHWPLLWPCGMWHVAGGWSPCLCVCYICMYICERPHSASCQLLNCQRTPLHTFVCASLWHIYGEMSARVARMRRFLFGSISGPSHDPEMQSQTIVAPSSLLVSISLYRSRCVIRISLIRLLLFIAECNDKNLY